MFYWKKLGKVFDPTIYENRPEWCNEFAQGENSIILKDRIRVFFCCREKPDENGQTVSRVSYVDLDKSNPLKIINIADHPVFEPGKIGAFDEFGTYPFCPIKVEEKVYGYYGGVQRCESIPFTVQIGCVISDDNGNTFNRIGAGPVLTSSLYEPYMVCSPKVRVYNGKWYMFYSAGYKWTKEQERPEICYKIRMAVSDDGIEWKKLNTNILPNTLGDLESQACGDIIYKNGKYHMFFCYRGHTDFRKNKSNSYRISYACSDDLMNWKRFDDKAGIDVSDNENDWDGQMVAYPHIFEANDNIYMLYLGNQVGRYGFGIAQLVGGLE